MRTKILLSVALGVGIAALVLLLLDVVEQSTITALLFIGLVCVSIEFIMGKKFDNSDGSDE